MVPRLNILSIGNLQVPLICNCFRSRKLKDRIIQNFVVKYFDLPSSDRSYRISGYLRRTHEFGYVINLGQITLGTKAKMWAQHRPSYIIHVHQAHVTNETVSCIPYWLQQGNHARTEEQAMLHNYFKRSKIGGKRNSNFRACVFCCVLF